jgi:AsmA-like protein
MKREDHRQNRRILAFAAFAVVFCLTLPFLLAEDPTEAILKASSVRAADQGSYFLSEPLQILSEPRILVKRGTVSLAQPTGAAPLSSREVAQLLESGKGVLILHDAEIVIGGKKIDGAAHSRAIRAPLARALANMNLSALIVERGTLKIIAAKGPATLRDVQLRVRPVPGERMTAKGSFELLGRTLQFDTTIGYSAADRAAQQLPIRGTLANGDLLQASFDGLFALGNGGRLIANTSHVQIKDVPVFARWLGLSWPTEFGLETFQSDGQMEWAGQTLNFPSSRFKLDANSAAGSLMFNCEGERPLIDGTLAFERLELSALMARSRSDATTSIIASTVQKTANWMPPRLRQFLTEKNLPILRQLDIDLRVSAGSTIAGDMALGRTAAALTLHDGRILLDLAEMQLPNGGAGSLQLTVDASRPVAQCGVRGQLKSVRFENLTDLVFPHQVITGPADVTMDLSCDWYTPETFVRSLGGQVAVEMRNGATLRTDLPRLVKSVGIDEPPKSGWGDAARGQMGLQSMSAHVVFENGVARIDRLRGERRGHSEVAVTGSFNIHRRSLDLSLFPRTEKHGGETPSVLYINGRWDKPLMFRRLFPNKAENPLYPETSPTPPKRSGRPSTRG